MNNDITEYNKIQDESDREICDLLRKEIDSKLPNAESKIWHAHPVWFIEGNPVVGYHKLKDSVRILFWSGQSFDEPNLTPEGSFKAADARFTNVDQINVSYLHRWLKKAQEIQWDYKNIVKRRGKLIRIKQLL